MEIGWKESLLLLVPSFYLGWKYVDAQEELAASENHLKKTMNLMLSKLLSAKSELAQAESTIETKETEAEEIRESLKSTAAALGQLEEERKRLQTACIAAAEKEKKLLAELETRKKAWDQEVKSLKTAENQYKSKLQDAVDKVREFQMLLSSKETEWKEEKKSLKSTRDHYKSKWQEAGEQLCQLRKFLDQKEVEWDEEKRSLKSTKKQYKSELQETAEQLRQLKSAFANTEREWNQERKALTTAGVEVKERLQETENRLEKSNIENSKNQQQIQALIAQVSQLSKKLEGLLDVKYIKKLQEDLAISNLQVSELRKELSEKENVVRRLQHDLICMREKAAEGERLAAKNKSSASKLKSQQEKERTALQQELDALKQQALRSEETAEQWKVKFEGMTQRCEELQNAADAREREVKSLPLQPEAVFLPEQAKEALLPPQLGGTGHPSTRTIERASEIAKECVVCMDRDKSMLLEPCRHVCVCKPCSKNVHQCPLCSRNIKHRKFIYL